MGNHADSHATRIEDLLVHADWLRHLATRLVHDGTDTEDLVQETWTSAMRSPPRAEASAARPWLAEVVRNLVRQRWRRRGLQERTRRHVMADGEVGPSPEDLLLRAQLHRQLADLVVRLDEPYRAAILLRYYDGKTGAEIAQHLGIPAGTVRWRLSEGLERLRRSLDDEHGDRKRWRALLAPLTLPRIGKAKGSVQPVPPVGAWSVARATLVKLAALMAAGVVGAYVIVDQRERAQQSKFLVAAARSPLRTSMTFDANDKGNSASLHGVVIDPDDRPVANAVVVLTRASESGGVSRESALRGTAVTDAQGHFHFANVPAGVFRATATSTAYVASVSSVFSLANTSKRIDLRLSRSGHTLRGRILDDGGGGIPNARLTVTLGAPWEHSLYPGHVLPVFETVSDQDGRYGLRLAPRGYHVTVSADGYAPAKTTVALNRDVVREVRLQPAARLFGTVIDRATQRPVAGARVSLVDGDPRHMNSAEPVTSDAEGRFGFDDLGAGSYQILARAPQQNLAGLGPTFTVVALQTVSGVVVSLDPGAVVTGHVLDAKQAPLEGATVSVVPTDVLYTARLGSDTTDRTGAFSVPALFSGRFRLNALQGDATAAAEVGVDPGGKAEVKLVLEHPGQTTEVAGHVYDQQGHPAPGCLVRVALPNGRALGVTGAESDERGAYRFRQLGATGNLELVVWHPEKGTTRVPFSVRERESAVVDAHLSPGATISGVVRYEDGQAAADIGVGVTRQQGVVFFDGATTDAEGRFEVRHLSEGTYAVRAIRKRGPSNIWTAQERPFVKLVQVTAGEFKQGVTLEIKRGGRTMSGTVVNARGLPAAGVTVVANREIQGKSWKPSHSELEFATTANEDGVFRLDDLEEGTFSLWALQPGNPDGEVKGVPAGRTDVRIVLPEPGSILGQVIDEAGRPARAYSLRILPALGDNPSSDDRYRRMIAEDNPPVRVADADGRFRLDGLAAGRYQLQAKTSTGGALAEVDVGQGEVKNGIALKVVPARKARGRVVRLDNGRPVPDSLVNFAVPGRRAFLTLTAEGEFSIDGLQPGEQLRVDARDGANEFVPEFLEVQIPEGAGTLDLGTLRLLPRRRAQPGDQRGVTGLRVTMKSGQVELEPKGASPAARAGVKAGDRVRKIDDSDVHELGPGAIDHLLARKPGESATLVVQAPGEAPRVVTVIAEKRAP
ncbi:MAG TPA: sigma-70 family RNA polymerase sigma factor [Polyangia bacterium]